MLDRRTLGDLGYSRSAVAAQIRANRWQLVGRAIVCHNAVLSPEDQRHVALINCEPGTAWTSLTALEVLGLQGWRRDIVHVIGSAGARAPTPSSVPVHPHRSTYPLAGRVVLGGKCHTAAAAVVVACADLDSARSACGLAAAAVQQRLASADDILREVTRSGRVRHRRVLINALHDIGMGAHALSEIDFARLCRSAGLPEPERQAVRSDATGRRRYLDAVWRTADGRIVTVEVDGGLHLDVSRWWNDQNRQNELTLTGHIVLRFPAIVIRTDPAAVLAQLRRALRC